MSKIVSLREMSPKRRISYRGGSIPLWMNSFVYFTRDEGDREQVMRKTIEGECSGRVAEHNNCVYFADLADRAMVELRLSLREKIPDKIHIGIVSSFHTRYNIFPEWKNSWSPDKSEQ